MLAELRAQFMYGSQRFDRLRDLPPYGRHCYEKPFQKVGHQSSRWARVRAPAGSTRAARGLRRCPDSTLRLDVQAFQVFTKLWTFQQSHRCRTLEPRASLASSSARARPLIPSSAAAGPNSSRLA